MARASLRRLNKKYVRVPSGKAKVVFEKKKTGVAKCAITGSKLQGTPRNTQSVRKASRTERRPEVLFGGILSAKARNDVFEEAIKVKTGKKELKDVSLKLRKYVEQAVDRLAKNMA